MKGVIASDIDGTLTGEDHLIPDLVVEYLHFLHNEGWQICLVTGRSYGFAHTAIDKINFPFLLALQNGSEILSMPDKKILFQHFLTFQDLIEIEKIWQKFREEDYIIYSGQETGDFCYYRETNFSPRVLEHLNTLKKLSFREWQCFETIDEIEQKSYPLVKCFGSQKVLLEMEKEFEKLGRFSFATLKDPLHPGLYLILVTTKIANKGNAITFLKNTMKWQGPLIVAGDQTNDFPLFEVGEYKIAMGDGDTRLIEKATTVAPPSKEMGIIQGLKETLAKIQ